MEQKMKKQVSDSINNRKQVLNPISVEEYINSDEVCKITGLKRATINQFRNDGKIPYYRLNNRLCYYKRSEIISWFESRLTSFPAKQ